MRALFAWVALLLGLVFAAPAFAATQHIHIQGFAFNPRDASIVLGDTVTWDNHDGSTHTTTDRACPRAGGAGPCEWDSFNMGTGGTFTHTFSKNGLFTYMCTIHGFTGTLLVDDPALFPDLVVESITVTNSGSFNNGVTAKRIDVVVRNTGLDPSAANKVRIGYEYQGGVSVILEPAVPALGMSGTRTLTTVWDTSAKIGDFTLVAIVDFEGVVAESDEVNNQRTLVVSLVTPPGTVPGTDLLDPV